MDKHILEKNMQLMQTGSEEAFEKVYNLTRKQVFYTIFAIIKDYSLAEELMQDTFIKIRQTINKYKPNTNAYAWIITVARNLSINAYNKRKREVIVEPENNDFIFNTATGNAEEEIVNNLLLKKLLEKLTLEERQVILMHDVLGFKHKEIAQELNKPLGTVLWFYNKTMKKLKQLGGATNEQKEIN